MQFRATLRYQGSTPTTQRTKHANFQPHAATDAPPEGGVPAYGKRCDDGYARNGPAAAGNTHEEWLKGGCLIGRRSTTLNGHTQTAQLETSAGTHGHQGKYTRGCSSRPHGLGKPPWHVLAEFLIAPMTITMQWRLATRCIPEPLDHCVHTLVPENNRRPMVSNIKPLKMLPE